MIIDLGRDHKGIAIVSTVGLISTVATLSLALLYGNLYQIRAAERFESRIMAFNWAEGAIDRTIVELKEDSSYEGLPATDASTGTLNGSYSTTVTDAGETGRYQISASSSVGDYNDAYGAQSRSITAVVQLPTGFPFPAAMFGKESVSVTGQASTDAYDSSENPTYDALAATAEGNVGTNGTGAGSITVSGNGDVNGDATVGPGANVASAITINGANASISGTKSAAASEVDLPDVTVPSGLTNLGAISKSSDGSYPIAAGTYQVDSISITSKASLQATSGPVILYVTGDITLAGKGVVTADNLPTNLIIYVAGENTVHFSADAVIYAAIYAPESDVNLTGKGDFYGAVVGETIDNSGQGSFHYDKALEDLEGGGGSEVEMVAWSEEY